MYPMLCRTVRCSPSIPHPDSIMLIHGCARCFESSPATASTTASTSTATTTALIATRIVTSSTR